MLKMSDQVRLLVGLENLLRKARRRLRECEREEGQAGGPHGARYAELVGRLAEEIHSVDRRHLEEYLSYVESSLLPRLADRVERTKEQMVDAAKAIVDGKALLGELKGEHSDALERSRTLRERLGLPALRQVEAHFILGPPPPNVERRIRDAWDLVREYLRS